MGFSKQIIRRDVLKNIIKNISDVSANELFEIIISDNSEITDKSRVGFLFETLSIILLICKCLKINYLNIMKGQLQSLKICKNVNDILNLSIVSGNNPSDITIKNNDKIIAFSIKYKKKFLPNNSGVSEIDSELSNIIKNYSVGLIVKNKSLVENHNYNNENGNQKILHDKLIEEGLLLDKNDIIKGLELFHNNFKNYNNVDEFIEMINKDYLLSPRKLLTLKLHQKMTFNKFIKNKKQTMHLISHKPRSGKSITILNICKYLLEHQIDKILIMTAVPSTIDSFIKDLNNYIDFKNINYVGQEDFKKLNIDFNGIVFCSVQYLKINVEEKKEYLKKIKFDIMIFDECHMGSSTEKTEKEILNIDTHIDEIRNGVNINIFSYGTSDKTKKFYKIKTIYEWDIEDEGYMKSLLNDNLKEEDKKEILDIMINRHGNEFMNCYNDNTLNKDYSKHPTQVLMKHLLPTNIINEIKEYNKTNNTNYGYSCNSLLALRKIKNNKTKKYEYVDMFELEGTSDGIDLLQSFFECIISSKKMNKTSMMKKIEETQTKYNSRISNKNEPKLFIIYLPTHTRNNNISQLQKNLKRFIEKYNLWSDYNIEYSNSLTDSGYYKEDYNDYIQTIINKAQKNNKKGCLLLLGNKGSVGITYHDCDVTISLDDGHNLDNQRQRYSRALTEAKNKTIGINVDMNIQRTYLYLNNIIHKHKKLTNTNKSNGEILKYLYEHNIFLFNPSDINNGNVKTFEITEFYIKEAENILNNIDDTNLLNEIMVVDDNIILGDDEFGLEFSYNEDTHKIETKIINPDFEGEQKDCPSGEADKIFIEDTIDITKQNNLTPSENTIEEIQEKQQITESKIEKQKRILKEVCKRVLFPLLSLLSRTFKDLNFKDMIKNIETNKTINSILKDKKIILNKNSYNSIMKIIDNNNEIINNIREIYKTAPANKIHQLIAKHFIPSLEEKKVNAEIPTPIILVEEMLEKIPEEFWKTPKKVFEPCCGKGNFVMKIFEKFFNGLVLLYPNVKKRCEIIIKDCLYYADLTPLNVFITTEILKCEIQSKCNEDVDYTFNKYTGDTLEMDIKKEFNIEKFDAVICNPPYQSPSDSKKNSKNLWGLFVLKTLDEFLKINGYMLFVHPSLWRKPSNKLKKIMCNKQILHLKIYNDSDGNKIFGASTRFDYYLIENIDSYKESFVIFEDGMEYNIMINNDLNFIPNYGWSIIQKIIHKLNNNNNLKAYSSSKLGTSNKNVSETKNELYCYELFNSSSKTNGITFRYSKIEHEIQKQSKVLFSNGRNICPFYDSGKYGVTQGGIYILVDNEEIGEKIVSYLNTNIIKFMIKASKWSNFETSKEIFWSMPFPNELKIINNDTINKYFELTENEINIINDSSNKINNNYNVIEYKQRNYYLIDDKLYKIKKDKSKGEYYCDYIDEKIIEKNK
jgi:hypothetical protein